jgi:hypothetical protein
MRPRAESADEPRAAGRSGEEQGNGAEVVVRRQKPLTQQPQRNRSDEPEDESCT